MLDVDAPLAEVFRPKSLTDFIGQEHLVGESSPIKRLLERGEIYSMIFWGPPGCGKTTLARILANEINAQFIEISPTTAGVKDIKASVEKAKSYKTPNALGGGQGSFEFKGKSNPSDMITSRTILFVDEIHRFSKAQQDYLLPHVENGTIILIGATTENPSFEIVSPLLSRCRVYVFYPIKKDDLVKLIKRAKDLLKSAKIILKMDKKTEDMLAEIGNGDARTVLNILDSALKMGINELKVSDIESIVQNRLNMYDKGGEEHYNTVSAFIKSMRASNADAALYYLTRMVNAGEDPLFIARRMVIFASEDIGLANSNALLMANAVFRACETIGYPECQLNLAHGVVYLSKSPKNRSCNDAYFKALDDVKKYGNLAIPLNLRNAPTKLMKDLGYGEGYEKYPEDKSLLPKEIEGHRYF